MKNIFKNNISPFVLLGLIVFVLFFDFFLHGYVLDGNHDVREMEVPMHVYKLRAVQDMTIPQWNPYIHCGTLFMGGGMDGLYYPPMFLAYLFPEKYITFFITLIMILHVYLAGAFAYLFFRRLIKDNFWALTSSVIYILSSASVINMTTGNMCFAFLTYLPLWLYLIYTHEERSFLRNLSYTSLALSMFFLIGMQQRILYTVWFAFLFILFQPARLRILATNLVSMAVAFCVSAMRMLPFLDNGRGGILTSVTFREAFQYCYIPFRAILRLFSPEFFGTKLHEGFLFSDTVTTRANHLETISAYAGIAAVFISIYVLFFIRNKKLRFWKTAFILIILMVFTAPCNYIHYIFSMKSALLFGRLAWFLPICMAVMTGVFGASFWESEKKLNGFKVFTISLVILVFIILWALYNDYRIMNIRSETIAAMRFSLYYYMAATFIFISILLIRARNISKYLLMAFILTDLFIIAKIDSNSSLRFLSPPESFRHYSYTEKETAQRFNENVSNRKFRIYSVSPWTNVNQCIKLGLYSSGGNDSFCSPYIARLYNRVYYLGKDRSAQAACRPSHITAMNLSSTAIIFYPEGAKMNKDPDFVPRVNVYTDYAVIKNDAKAFIRSLSKENKPRETVILDRTPSIEIPKSNLGGEARIVKDENELVVIEVLLPANSILLLTDTYHRGWKAYIDGEETEIMRGNYAFRAVSVPSGKHKIEFVFEHPAFKKSVIISAFGIILLAILLVISHIKPAQSAR